MALTRTYTMTSPPNYPWASRAEWFRDRDGFRVFSPGRVSAATNNQGLSYALGANQLGNATSMPADYYVYNRGYELESCKNIKIDWKPMQQFNVRPNVRYDNVDALHGATYRPFRGT